MNLVKRSFANIIDVINITFPCFLYPNDADRDGLWTCHCPFSWLNFSSKITLYQTYFPKRFKICAATISAISSFIFTHIQPTLKSKKKLNIFYSQHNQVTLCRLTFWQYIYIYIYNMCSPLYNIYSSCATQDFPIPFRTSPFVLVPGSLNL